jgi:hypothetical protein
MFSRSQSARAQVEGEVQATNQGQEGETFTILRSPRPLTATFFQIARITRPDVIDAHGTLTFGLCSITPAQDHIHGADELWYAQEVWPVGESKYLHSINSMASPVIIELS